MTKPIAINLDELTQEHIDRCAPHIGKCSYTAPCIIGTLTDAVPEVENETGLTFLLSSRVIDMPKDQHDEAIKLQDAFDGGCVQTLEKLLAKRGLRWPE